MTCPTTQLPLLWSYMAVYKYVYYYYYYYYYVSQWRLCGTGVM